MLGTAGCVGTLAAAGAGDAVGSCSLVPQAAGAQQLVVEYTGHDGFDASDSTFAVSVGKAMPTVSIVSHLPEPSEVDAPYFVAVHVSGMGGLDPTGTVTVGEGIASCNFLLSAGSGGCSLASPVVGVRTLTASYPGDANYAAAAASAAHSVVAGTRIFRDGFEQPAGALAERTDASGSAATLAPIPRCSRRASPAGCRAARSPA
jgi:hypothetical protein